MLSKLGYAALPADKFAELINAVNAMQANYAKVKICSYKDRTKCDFQLEPGILILIRLNFVFTLFC